MKIFFNKNFYKPIPLLISFISLITLNGDFLSAEYLSEDSLIDSSTKLDNASSALPTNPFEIMEMMRRYNSLSNATKPSDALDEALESFYDLEENK